MKAMVKSQLKKVANKFKTHSLYPEAYERHLDIDSTILDGESANFFMANLLMNEDPCMIARFGSEEINAMLKIERYQQFSLVERVAESYRNRTLDLWRSPAFKTLHLNAGFFSQSKESLEKFLVVMKDAVDELDLLGSWTKPETRYPQHLSKLPACELRYLEPYFHSDPWSKHLEGKRVLVIHPFANLIEQQYRENRINLFPDRPVLPEFSLRVVKAVQTIAGSKDKRFGDWFDALNWMEEEAISKDFDVAIIGCGAYGFPLAARLKKHGKKSIHLGGATQILFGIKGKRWDERVEFSSMYNHYWVRPGDQEKPNNYKVIEGGCYW